jgi:putative transposase
VQELQVAYRGAERGTPQSIRADHGPEFVSNSLDMWAYFNGVKLDFNGRQKPANNAMIESFNGRLRDGGLNRHWFLSLDEDRPVTDAWKENYNRSRWHGALATGRRRSSRGCHLGMPR